MTRTSDSHFSRKHGSDVRSDPDIQARIRTRLQDHRLPCAVAFDIVRTLNVSAAAVGRNVDLMDIRLAKCQMGLFGYRENKIVKPLQNVPVELENAIRTALEDGRLTCRRAWDIAAALDLPKLTVSCACETLKIKINSCQLGAF